MKVGILACVVVSVLTSSGCVVKTKRPHRHHHHPRHHRHLEPMDLATVAPEAPITDPRAE